jgi:hypothetical protein
MASYEYAGGFESLEFVRAILGERAAALDALLNRGELEERAGRWFLTGFLEDYDQDGRLRTKTAEERLAEAEDKRARGEAMTDAEMAARSRARKSGEDIPDGRTSSPDADLTSGPTTTTTTTTTKEVPPQPASDDAAVVVALYSELFGRLPTEKADAWLADLAGRYGSLRVTTALREEHRRDSSPRTILGRAEKGLKAGDSRQLGAVS